MNKNNINGLALQMAQDLMQSKPTMGLSLALSAVHFKMSSLVSQLRLKVDTQAGFGTAVSNFYGLSLSSSGSGKSVGVNLLDGFYFGEAFEFIKRDVFPKFKQRCEAELEVAGIERQLHAWTPKISNATLSGLYAYGETYYLAKMGAISVQIDELGDAVIGKAELFDILLECYNNGDFPAQAKRSDANALDIDGIPVNLYAFGDPTKLTSGDNTERAFQNLLKTGYGRRFIFSKDENQDAGDRSPQDIVREMKASQQIKVDRQEDRDFIKSLITISNMNRVLTLTEEALLFYATVQSEGENYVRNNPTLPEAVSADMLNRTFKLVKLASIYAFFEGNDEVEVQHMKEAFEIIDESSKVLAEIVKIKPTHVRLLESLLKEDKPVTSQGMLNYSFIPSSYTKKILEYIDLAKELASEEDMIWSETSKKGVNYYQVHRKTEREEEEFREIDEKEKIETKERTEAELMELLM